MFRRLVREHDENARAVRALDVVDLSIRRAVPDDVATLHRFASELAAAEDFPGTVEATPMTSRKRFSARGRSPRRSSQRSTANQPGSP